jgi:putative hydrolase of the HAD superfamily
VIEAVFFDLGDTLVKFNNNGSLLEKICFHTGLSKDKLLPLWHEHILTKDGCFYEILSSFFEAIKDNCNKEKLINIFNEHEVTPELFNETTKVLGELKKQNLFLGIISNTCALNYMPLTKLGLDKFIDLELLSFKEGIAKPNKGIYEIAEIKSQKAAEKILFVGDSITSDLFGAKGVGWRVILLNRKHDKLPDFCNKEIVISSLRPLTKMILNFNQKGAFN